MPPTVVELRSPESSVRLRTVGLAHPRPVVATAATTADLPPELAATLAPVLQGLLRSAARNDALVVTGGTDSGVIHLLGTASAAAQPPPMLVGVAPEGCVARTGSGDGRPGLEPHHAVVLLVPGSAWGVETPVLSRLVASVSKDLVGVCVVVGGGDVARLEVTEHLARGRTVVVLRGSGRLADE